MAATWMQTPLAGAARHLDRAAVVGGARPWTWREVHAASLALAARLREGATVCNLCGTRAGFLVAWLAALRRGCAQVLPPSGGAGDLVSILRSNTDPIIVVDDASLVEAGWAKHAQCLVFDASPPPSLPSGDELAWTPDAESQLVRLYTSGSTGTPEAQHKTLGHLARGAQVLLARLRQELRGEQDAIARIVCSVPPQHMFGLETSVMLSLIGGMPVQEGRPLLPGDVCGALADSHGSALWIATPVHLRAFTQAGERAMGARLVIASTMQLAPALAAEAEALVAAPVMEIYGSTETGAIAMRRTAHETAWRALDGVRLQSSPEGTQAWGGHFESPRQLSDHIELAADGSFRLLGRHGDMLKIAGRRASLAGLNQLLQEMPGLQDGVFFLPASDSPTQRLVLVYAGELARDAVLAWLRGRMDPVFLPRTVIRVERLPRAASGKLPRAALEEIHAAYRESRRRP
ncbi:AMP-binding protein [Ramlibacter sp. PS4R-6]|uniref:AMP-binding protein n=1 Tax=Ramlibacter sp. PS4R-6 TaxID=3133438 RepID=UPI0030968475